MGQTVMDTKAYRTELIQTAAVAVAMVEDLDKGSADSGRRERTSNTPTGRWADTYTDVVVDEVLWERQRQDAKWGPQSHEPLIWLAILLEEVGEVANEIPVDHLPTTDGSRWLRDMLATIEHDARRLLEIYFGDDSQ